MSDYERIESLLSALGKTPAEVARALESAGAKGRRRDHCECPVAVYLRREFPHLNVGAYFVNSATVIPVWMPEPVRKFIGLFDFGGYPELEAA